VLTVSQSSHKGKTMDIEKEINLIHGKLDYLTRLIENHINNGGQGKIAAKDIIGATMAQLKMTPAIKENPQMLDMVEKIFAPIMENKS
jgi:hypothetical protein